MLGRIPLHRFDVLNLRRPIINRYFAPTCSHRQLLSNSPAATAAAKDRRWVMLSSHGRRLPDDPSFVADANTAAESRTSKGRRLRVSFGCAAPPSSSSYLYYEIPKSSDDHNNNDDDRIRVVAAHGEFVLLRMSNHRSCCGDYFVCRPASARRPPSLSLLPVIEFSTKPESPDCVPASYFSPSFRPSLDNGRIGLLRRGENNVLVVHVDLWYDCDARWEKAVFSVLRPGMRRWELMKPIPVFKDGTMECSLPRDVICVGDRFLCCVWYGSRFLLCDMADEASPKVRFVRLPPEVIRCRYGFDDNPKKFRHMGAAGDSNVRFVSIHPHCCSVEYYDDSRYCCGCGDSDRKECCWHPRFVFTIKTWKMNLSMEEPLEWVQDGEIDSEEIWELPGYEGLPQAFPEWPIVCLGKANVVCFLVSNYDFTRVDKKVWMVELNMNTKTLLSVVQLTYDDYRSEYYRLPAEV